MNVKSAAAEARKFERFAAACWKNERACAAASRKRAVRRFAAEVAAFAARPVRSR